MVAWCYCKVTELVILRYFLARNRNSSKQIRVFTFIFSLLTISLNDILSADCWLSIVFVLFQCMSRRINKQCYKTSISLIRTSQFGAAGSTIVRICHVTYRLPTVSSPPQVYRKQRDWMTSYRQTSRSWRALRTGATSSSTGPAMASACAVFACSACATCRYSCNGRSFLPTSFTWTSTHQLWTVQKSGTSTEPATSTQGESASMSAGTTSLASQGTSWNKLITRLRVLYVYAMLWAGLVSLTAFYRHIPIRIYAMQLLL